MNKQEMITAVQNKVNEGIVDKKDMYSKPVVEKFITAIFETIKEAVVKDETVSVPGFGKFKKRLSKGREGTSKLGGVEKAWKTEDSYKPVFSASKLFEDKVKGI
jgi:DNA-binding protein HU-beta